MGKGICRDANGHGCALELVQGICPLRHWVAWRDLDERTGRIDWFGVIYSLR